MTAVDTRTVHTFCRYCLASCGVEVTVEDNHVTKISPDKQNPHTWQDFCAKGRTANQLVEHPKRILNPMRRVRAITTSRPPGTRRSATSRPG